MSTFKEPKEIVMRQRADFSWARKPLIVIALAGLTATLAFFKMENLAGWALFATILFVLAD